MHVSQSAHHHHIIALLLQAPIKRLNQRQNKRITVVIVTMSCPQTESSCTMPLSIRPNLVLVSAAFALLLTCSASCTWMAHGFAPSSILQRHTHSQRIHIPSTTITWASREKETETWSKSAAATSSSSRFGVRRRVRKVLERAKDRTGIKNASSQLTTQQSTSSIIAESASIGGLGGDFVVDSNKGGSALNGNKNNGKQPPEELVLASSSSESNQSEQVDAIRSDVPAAVKTTEPLPFKLPVLKDEQRKVLYAGERLQEQTKMGRDGSGYVVVDVKAPEYVVWECLLDFASYTETIPTVRDVTMLTSTHLKSGYHAEKPVLPGNDQLRHYGTPSLTRAAFTLSKFRLKIAAIHNYHPHPEGHYMDFCLDPDCTNLVLKDAKGIWYTQTNPDDRGEEYTRVWLLCELKVSRALPKFIVDYAAQRAMPRATTWLKPQVEAAASLWLKNGPPNPPSAVL